MHQSNHVQQSAASCDARCQAGGANRMHVQHIACGEASLQDFLDELKHGPSHIFLTGIAGSGKTQLLMDYALPILRIRYPGDQLWVGSTTGMTAQAIGGQTLHSLSGLGRMLGDISELLGVMPTAAKQRWPNLNFCLCEECSLISADQVQNLNDAAVELKDCSDPYGGVRMMWTGTALC